MDIIFAYFAGMLTMLMFGIMFSFFDAGARHDERHAEEQPDIRLTKIKSEHVRSIYHD